MAEHPELQTEQQYLERAYDLLERARQRVMGMRRMTTIGPGGTHQARYESEAVEDAIRARLAQLHLGDVALVFGRIDHAEAGSSKTDHAEAGSSKTDHAEAGSDGRDGELYYIGRVAVADENQEPVVVDWRAPVAEPFYRATGRHPMGLSRRRHFSTRGRQLLGIEDDNFGAGGTGTGSEGELVGPGALLAVLGRSRTGYLGDIVATIQREQDEIIRSELAGVLVVQGGPGTGKTVVALHRAAYLLYTHRFPLEGQGVLVVGPNRLYLRYIERVLPSLGEAGVEMVVPADLVPEPVTDGPEERLTALVKGDARMARTMARAVRDRQRALRGDLAVGFGLMTLRCSVEASQRIIHSARRHSRTHNGGRRLMEQGLWEELAASARGELNPDVVRERLRRTDEMRAALEWMWPLLTPGELLRDLFGSAALIRSAGRGWMSAAEQAALLRPRSPEPVWTTSDVPLLDEARTYLGTAHPRSLGEDESRSYGHIVIDEAQDLSPMQLRMLARRSLNGSMTVVGDMAQATRPWAPARWSDVLAHLPQRRAHRMVELSIGYRTPASIMALANRVLAVAAPELQPPRAVRVGEEVPVILAVVSDELTSRVAELAGSEAKAVGEGNVAVIAADSQLGSIASAMRRAGVSHGEAERVGFSERITLAPVRLVKGLELDSVIVVEPARLVAEEPQGLRALYVALTRPTRHLSIVHAEPLPPALT